MYTKKRTLKTTIWWECVKRTSHLCKGSVKTDVAISEVLDQKPHCHGGEEAAVTAAKAKELIKERCMDTRDKPQQILASALMGLNQRTKEIMPTENNCKQIRYHRKKKLPKVPSSLKELQIDGEWATTGGDYPEPFLLHDNGSDANSRIVMFATKDCLQLMCKSKIWFMDGNYKMAPKHFSPTLYLEGPFRKHCSFSYVYSTPKKKPSNL